MAGGTGYQKGAANTSRGTTPAAASSGMTISYTPLGESSEITLTLARVKQFLCIPTKSGQMPSDEQVIKYMMLCKAQSLNPWVNDAYLVGYDGQDGPTFSLIVAHQAVLKRAEASREYDGMSSGVIVVRDGTLTERPGDLVLSGETLVGGWARVHRRDRSVPSYDALNLKTFDTGRSRWKADPAGQIVKCAEASALRKAFPSNLSAMYCREEMDNTGQHRPSNLTERTMPDEMTAVHGISHEPQETAFEPDTTVRETVPVQTERRETTQRMQDVTDGAPSFADMIADAMTPKALGKLHSEFTAAHAAGAIDYAELDRLTVLAQERRKEVQG